MSDKHALPAEGFVRLKQIIGDRKNGIAGVIPISMQAWYKGVSEGRFPKPVKIGSASFWRVSDIRELMAKIDRGQA